ncbi:unnamed protein product [Durusdinium trenchii]|uniref:Amino acid transporter transmembrane domain-containing protein n=1 Tax=Durusdinium trenchii TaxID=1381693 RepID=A0ABP0SW43_9DINO
MNPRLKAKRSAGKRLEVDEVFKRSLLEDILPTSAPEFMQSTEDGIVFRIYRLGRLEVRTAQAPNSEQEILSVFSQRPVTEMAPGKMKAVSQDEKFIKGRLYVEAIEGDHKDAAKQLHLCHFYVVLETKSGHTILTEKLADGSTTWVVNPNCLEDRNSLAKLMVCLDIRMEPFHQEACVDLGRSAKTHSHAALRVVSPVFTTAGVGVVQERKRYAREIFSLAHTVLLRSDGSAVACGCNHDGQCNIPPLEEGMSYTQVFAGFSHTVLLRSDGHAVACGDNRDGQCDLPPFEPGNCYIASFGEDRVFQVDFVEDDAIMLTCLDLGHEKLQLKTLGCGLGYLADCAGIGYQSSESSTRACTEKCWRQTSQYSFNSLHFDACFKETHPRFLGRAYPYPSSSKRSSEFRSEYRFTLSPAVRGLGPGRSVEDLTPPTITVVSMYGISENVIRVTIRLDDSGTTYCRAYDSSTFTPVSQGGTDVPTLTDCTACLLAINTGSGTNFMGTSTYDSTKGYAQHEVDISGLAAKTFYWVYCYSHDDEIPTVNVATSSQMLATERQVRTLDTTAPSFGTFTCAETPATEDSITVTLSLNEAGRAYCKVVNTGFDPPTPNAVIAEGFYMDVTTTSDFTIIVNQITTGLGSTGMESLHAKWDYDVYCWAQDAEGYPYYGPNGMVAAEACPSNPVTTLDLTRPSLRFIMAESISSSQIIITLQVDEGAKEFHPSTQQPSALGRRGAMGCFRNVGVKVRGAGRPRFLLLVFSLSLGYHWCFAAPTAPPRGSLTGRIADASGTARPHVAFRASGSGEASAASASVSDAGINLAKNLVGSGILSLPAGIAAFASSSSALWVSLLLLGGSAGLSAYTFYLIGKVCQETESASFGAAWEKSVQSGKWIPQWVCILECFGGAVVYAMVLGDVFSSSFQNLPAKFSLLGTLATSYVVLFVVKRFLDGSYAAGGQFFKAAALATSAHTSIFNPQMLVLVALLSTAFLVHFNAPQFFVELPPAKPTSEEKQQKLKDFSKVSLIGFGIASLQYALVMCFGFLTFGQAVSGTLGLRRSARFGCGTRNVLLNYDAADPWATVARLAVGVSMLFGYPMQFAGFRDGLLELGHIDRLPTVKHRLVTGALLAVAVAVACFFRDLGLVQAVEGALLAAFLVFLAGPIMALKLPFGRAPRARRAFQALIVLGVSFMGIGCAVNFGFL